MVTSLSLKCSLFLPSLSIIAKRKQTFAYYDNYLKHGFASVVINGEIWPQFVLCLEVLAHGSLKEA